MPLQATVAFVDQKKTLIDRMRIPIDQPNILVRDFALASLRRLSRRHRLAARDIAVTDVMVEGECSLFYGDRLTDVVDVARETIYLRIAEPLQPAPKTVALLHREGTSLKNASIAELADRPSSPDICSPTQPLRSALAAVTESTESTQQAPAEAGRKRPRDDAAVADASFVASHSSPHLPSSIALPLTQYSAPSTREPRPNRHPAASTTVAVQQQPAQRPTKDTASAKGECSDALDRTPTDLSLMSELERKRFYQKHKMLGWGVESHKAFPANYTDDPDKIGRQMRAAKRNKTQKPRCEEERPQSSKLEPPKKDAAATTAPPGTAPIRSRPSDILPPTAPQLAEPVGASTPKNQPIVDEDEDVAEEPNPDCARRRLLFDDDACVPDPVNTATAAAMCGPLQWGSKSLAEFDVASFCDDPNIVLRNPAIQQQVLNAPRLKRHHRSLPRDISI